MTFFFLLEVFGREIIWSRADEVRLWVQWMVISFLRGRSIGTDWFWKGCVEGDIWNPGSISSETESRRLTGGCDASVTRFTALARDLSEGIDHLCHNFPDEQVFRTDEFWYQVLRPDKWPDLKELVSTTCLHMSSEIENRLLNTVRISTIAGVFFCGTTEGHEFSHRSFQCHRSWILYSVRGWDRLSCLLVWHQPYCQDAYPRIRRIGYSAQSLYNGEEILNLKNGAARYLYSSDNIGFK